MKTKSVAKLKKVSVQHQNVSFGSKHLEIRRDDVGDEYRVSLDMLRAASYLLFHVFALFENICGTDMPPGTTIFGSGTPLTNVQGRKI